MARISLKLNDHFDTIRKDGGPQKKEKVTRQNGNGISPLPDGGGVECILVGQRGLGGIQRRAAHKGKVGYHEGGEEGDWVPGRRTRVSPAPKFSLKYFASSPRRRGGAPLQKENDWRGKKKREGETTGKEYADRLRRSGTGSVSYANKNPSRKRRKESKA